MKIIPIILTLLLSMSLLHAGRLPNFTVNKIDSAHVVYGLIVDSTIPDIIPNIKVYFKGTTDTLVTDGKYRLPIPNSLFKQKAIIVVEQKDYITQEIPLDLIEYPVNLDVYLVKKDIKKNQTKEKKEVTN